MIYPIDGLTDVDPEAQKVFITEVKGLGVFHILAPNDFKDKINDLQGHEVKSERRLLAGDKVFFSTERIEVLCV